MPNRLSKIILDRKAQVGFSLVETMLVFLVISVMVGMTAISLNDSVDREGPRALVYTVAADIRAARAEAQKTGTLVAVCFPSETRTNPLSRAAVIRRGLQRGSVHKVKEYDSEYSGAIFSGSWTGSVLETTPLDFGWRHSVRNDYTIIFKPDGTAFSNNIPSLNGRYPLVVGSQFATSAAGTDLFQVTAVTNPNTIWVSRSGIIEVEEKTTPVTGIPAGGSEPVVAALDLSGEPSPRDPSIELITFLPKPVLGTNEVGLGQSYAQVRPDYKDPDPGDDVPLEYGIATMQVYAKDNNGGPLYYELTATASEGDSGKFSVSKDKGQLSYVDDDRAGESGKIWRGILSWRPPPGAEDDWTYSFDLRVFDGQNNSTVATSGAGLLPVVRSLVPSRIVLATEPTSGSNPGALYLGNIEANSLVHLNKGTKSTPATIERNPFFSADGTRIYSFEDIAGGGVRLIVRNADGGGREVLREFTSNVVDLKFDPSFSYAAYLTNIRPAKQYEGYTLVAYQHTTGSGDNEQTETRYRLDRADGQADVASLQVLHLNSKTPPTQISGDVMINIPASGDLTKCKGLYQWDGDNIGVIQYNDVRDLEPPADLVTPTPAAATLPPNSLSPFIPSPGHEPNTRRAARITGAPPVAVPAPGGGASADDRFFNLTAPKWFLEKSGPSGQHLSLVERGSTGQMLCDAGCSYPIVDNPRTDADNPNWSATGTSVTYLEDTGSGIQVVIRNLLTGASAPFTQDPSPTTTIVHTAPGITSAKLAPRGQWVFMLKNGKLFRADAVTGSNLVHLSKDISGRVDSFSLSR